MTVRQPSLSFDGQPEPSTVKQSLKIKFTKKEDEQLSKSWAAFTVDDAVNTNKAGDKLWERIMTHYCQHPVSSFQRRDANQLRSRWRIICREITKWHYAMEEATKSNTVESNEFDIKNLAQHLYANVKLEKDIPFSQLFKFQTCYDIVCTTEKWKQHLINRQKQDKKNKLDQDKSKKRPITDSMEKDDNAMDDSIDEDTVTIDRPLPCKKIKTVLKKKQKQKQKKGSEEHIIQSQLNVMDTKNQKALAKEMKTKNAALALEIKIMMQDGGPGSKERREQYFAMMQKSIIERRMLEDEIKKEDSVDLKIDGTLSESDDANE